MSEPETDLAERVISSEPIYEGKALAIRRVVVQTAAGRRGSRVIVEHPGSAAVVPLRDDGMLVLIRQYRLAAGGVLWEIPAGHIEPGESPEACARRELEEETGYRAGSVEPLFEAYLSPGSSNELMRFFLATHLESGEQRTEEDESISVEPLGVSTVARMISTNEVKDAKTIAAISYMLSAGVLPLPGRAPPPKGQKPAEGSAAPR